nr:putative membrane protein [Cedratvirus lena]WIL04575.1 putative membrane protein [Cedratvirus duvanny]
MDFIPLPPLTEEEKRDENLIYVGGIVVWFIIVYLLGLLNGDPILFVIVLIPVLVFVSYILNKKCTVPSFHRTSSEFLYIILAIFLAWVLVSNAEKQEIVHILLVSLAIYIISLVEFRVCSKMLYDALVIIPMTMSLILLLAAVYLYFKGTKRGLGNPSINVL